MQTEAERTATPEEFAELLRPTVDALLAVTEAARRDRADRSAPAANSRAMAEIAEQNLFPGSDEAPVDVARTLASLSLHAGQDHIRAMCTLLVSGAEAFAWSVPVLVRASLEAFAQCRHLSQCDISSRLRAGRTLNELIESSRNVYNLPEETHPAAGDPARRSKQAEALGLQRVTDKRGNSTRWFEELRPKKAELVASLMGENDLGFTLYSYLSAIAHSASWGLTETMGPIEPHPTGVGHRAPIVVTLDFVRTLAGIVTFAHHEAFSHFMTFNGWPTIAYDAAQPQVAWLVGLDD
jgi:hypothetical protein